MGSNGKGTRMVEMLVQRATVLKRLDEGPIRKRDLVEQLEASRSTVDRAIRELEARGLVERGNDGYASTVAGRMAADRLEWFEAGIDDVVDAQAVLSPLPADARIDRDVVLGGETEVAAEPIPSRPIERFHDAVEAADRYRAVLPALDDSRHVRLLYDHVVARGNPAEVVVSPDLFETLREEFSRQFAVMADHEEFELLVAEDLPPYVLGLAGSGAETTVTVVVFGDSGVVHGVVTNDRQDALEWAQCRFETERESATNRTGELDDGHGGSRGTDSNDGPDSSLVGRSLPAGLERAGFVRVDASYFLGEPVADPTTTWRAGLSLAEVNAGYAVGRTVDPRESGEGDGDTGDDETLTERLLADLTAGTDRLVVGPPGSGKSTVCKRVACEWYDADRGPVVYREGGRGRAFAAVEDLLAVVKEADGHPLVVVEDAVRPDASAVFEAVDRLAGRDDVSFLLDARETEWRDPPGEVPDVAGLEVATMPSLTDHDAARLVEQFERTVGETVDVPVDRLREEVRAESTDDDAFPPGEVLLLLHRLATYADPLADGRTSLEAEVAGVYDDLAGDDVAVAVCTLVNALNAAGLDAGTGVLYAVADPGEFDAVDAAIERLEGRLLFPRGDATYRTVHESWSTAFLTHLLATEGDAAADRFGDAVTALLALADDPDRRDAIADHVGDGMELPAIGDDPAGWVADTVETIYALGRERPKLAPLFGEGDSDTVTLPDTRPEGVERQRLIWLGQLFRDGDYYDRALAAVQRGLATLPETSRARYRLLGVHADVLLLQGDRDEARAVADRQRELAVELGARDLEALAIDRLGRVAHARGDYERACDHRETAFAILEELGDRKARMTVSKTLGITVMRLGDHEQAREYIEKSRDLARELGDRHFASICDANLGWLAFRRGEYDRAREHFMETLELHRAIGDRKREATGLANLGNVALNQGAYETAREYIEESLDIVEETGERMLVAENRLNLGSVAYRRGNHDRARELYEASLALAREIDDQLRVAKSRVRLAATARERGDYDRARTHLDAAAAADADDDFEMARVPMEELRLALACPDAEPSRERAASVVETYESLDATHWVARSRRLLGRVLGANGEYGDARDHLTTALETFEETGASQDALLTLEYLVDVCEQQDDEAAVEQWVQRASAVAADAPDPTREAHGDWLDAYLDLLD